jgi:hypothetical protein
MDEGKGQATGEETAKLIARMRFAHLEAGSPPLRAVARRTGGGLSASTISRMLKAGKPPKLENLVHFLRALGVPEAELPAWRQLWSKAANEANPINPSPGDEDGPPPRLVPGPITTTCRTCGALVADSALHRDWHRGPGATFGARSPRPMSQPRSMSVPVVSAR